MSAGSDHTGIELRRIRLGRHFEMHPIVFPLGALIVIGLVLSTFLLPSEQVQGTFVHLRDWIGDRFGWLYVAAMTGFLVLAVVLAFGKAGRIKLGQPDEKPEFGRGAWFAMLFSAGMGIGLLFWSVAEPVYHFNSTPPGLADGLDKSRMAMAVTIFHWGLHPWALYAIVGLALAYFGFNRRMPLSFRSLLHPLLGDRVWGFTGDVIDVLAIIATLTGVATSLGIGAQQVNAGLAQLFGIAISTPTQIILIAAITAVATVSVVMGLHTGIRRLSETNMILAGLLLVLVVIAGGLMPFFGSAIENTGAYLQILPFNSFRTGAFNAEGRAWLNGWTVFYWAWWISWSPFVGMFIARVSRGRTIREFIIGVLLVPTAVGIVWLTAFGTSTLRVHNEHISATAAYESALGDERTNGDGLMDPDASLPSYPVLEQGPGGFFALSEDGALIGPNGGEYARGASGGVFVEQHTEARVVIDDGQLVSAQSGDAYVPPPDVAFDGAYASTEEALTPVEYLSAPVLTVDHTQRIDRLPTVLFTLINSLFGSSVMATIAIGIATLCIILFFVTSSDSASMVIDIIASGGNPDPPVGTRLFWAITEGVVASALLLAGGLIALQAASIAVALPFTIILILACVSLMKALRQDYAALGDEPDA
ncbi:MAG: BCCT family transporter [Phycisphaerales bacterium]